TVSGPLAVVLSFSPRGTEVPTITGGSTLGGSLSCSEGKWAPDFVASSLLDAPKSFAYQWSLNGANVPGADQSQFTPLKVGDYKCKVTASNRAGKTTQESAVHHVDAQPSTQPKVEPPHTTGGGAVGAFGAATGVSIKLASRRVPVH